MIPKKIHYCWFGKKSKTLLAKKCIASWEKFCPDYEIIEWNEDNFDVEANGYTKMCYETKKYAFLSDYVRLKVVAEYGGFYFDTDVELLQSLDQLRMQEAYFGFENKEYVSTGLGFGSVPKGGAILAMLQEYDAFLDGQHGTIGCPIMNTNALVKLGLVRNGLEQKLQNTMIYSPEVLNPYESATGKMNKTSRTISIHWYAASWLSWKKRIRSRMMKPLHRVFGVDAFVRFRK